MIEIRQNVIIPEAQHNPAIGLQPCRSGGIITEGLIFRMLATIQLDNQPLIRAGEVHDVTGNRNLPSEAEPLQPVRAYRIPEFQLRVCHCLAHALGIGTTQRRNRRMGHGECR